MWLNIFFVGLHLFTLSLLGFLYYKLLKAKKIITIVKYKLKTMNIDTDDIFEQMISEDLQPIKPETKQTEITAIGPNITNKYVADPDKVVIYKQRIAELISAGNSKEYLGKQITLDQLGKMSHCEIEKCYAIYEAKLGLKMTKSLGQSLITLYTASISHLFPIDNKEKLAKDLNDDPIINASLSSISSYLYFQYGAVLAPFAATMITFAHIINSENKNNNNIVISDGTDRNKSATDSNYTGTNSNYTAISTTTDSN